MLIPLKQGLKQRSTYTFNMGIQCLNVDSIKTRIETYPIGLANLFCLNVDSIKTRIETSNKFSREDIQGLNVDSIKTRIETNAPRSAEADWSEC